LPCHSRRYRPATLSSRLPSPEFADNQFGAVLDVMASNFGTDIPTVASPAKSSI
jgi:hypothetical protein